MEHIVGVLAPLTTDEIVEVSQHVSQACIHERFVEMDQLINQEQIVGGNVDWIVSTPMVVEDII